MLCEITIENVAVIEKATAQFGEGFTVLTGETGAGKSILIDSINAILGNRTSRDIVRSGTEKARIWARFSALSDAMLQRLEQAGYPAEEDLLLYREITAEGKSSCRINGAPATAALLREVCAGLIAIHGQHDNQSLLNPALHLPVLDAFAQNEALLAQYSAAYGQLTSIQSEMRSLQMDEAEKARKLDLLRYEVDEIDTAELAEDEEEALSAQRLVIRNAQNILDGLAAAHYALAGDDDVAGATAMLGDAANHVSACAQFAEELEEFAGTLNEIYYTAGEIASDIQRRLTSYEFDGQALNRIEERLDLIYRLKQKYGPTVEAVLAYGEQARAQLESIESSAERLEALGAQQAAAQKQAAALAAQLHQSRQQAFTRLTQEIAAALEFLNMPGIVMTLHCTEVPLGPAGSDELEFYISTNPGETPKPLAKIASGGELARIMLAIKSALADRDNIPTVIYDEVDTGISGLAAGRIGQLLHRTAGAGRQVICVTHTAQVAAYADGHLQIQKEVHDGRTFTHISALEEDQRAEELARIVGGENVTEATLESARQMLQGAKKA